MIRATTGGVLRSYRSNLMNSFIASNKARETVLTQRNFNSYAEDPASAAKAFRLRMSRLTTKSQYDICEDTYYKYQSAFSCLQTVDQLIDTENGGTQLQTLKSSTLKMLNDPTGDARTQLSKVLAEMSETIVQNMNQKYGDDFIFAGADGHNVPFEVTTRADGTKQLLYRGVPVDAAEPDVLKDKDGNLIECDANGVPTANGGYYLKPGSVETIAADDYPEENYTFKRVDTTTDIANYKGFALFNADGDLYSGTNIPGILTSYPYLCPTLSNSDQVNPSLTLTQDQIDSLVPIEKYDEYCAAVGDPNCQWVTEDLVPPPEILRDANGDPVLVQNPNAKADASGISTQAADDYYLLLTSNNEVISKADYETACEDAAKLEYLANEKRFVDIGLGFQENEDGKLIESSAFNESLNGLTFLGYGLDEDGDPKNIYSIVQRLTEIADSVPDGTDWSQEVYDEFDRLVGKLEDASSAYKTEFTNMDASTTKLKSNLDLLEDNFYNLDEQTSNLEDVDMVEAITSFIWAEYCYNAALKVGNSILSQSLMDYMN